MVEPLNEGDSGGSEDSGFEEEYQSVGTFNILLREKMFRAFLERKF